jgi:hypothetical protein
MTRGTSYFSFIMAVPLLGGGLNKLFFFCIHNQPLGCIRQDFLVKHFRTLDQARTSTRAPRRPCRLLTLELDLPP